VNADKTNASLGFQSASMSVHRRPVMRWPFFSNPLFVIWPKSEFQFTKELRYLYTIIGKYLGLL
jgi:hypothetical protein